ncbi:MAG: phosphonate ABC transporter ATP-binding protein, partial [Rhizobiales bacterium]|nr:phosphonate ABC transporter ATP-binding protein [Hyphomicrobiales bacterium]
PVASLDPRNTLQVMDTLKWINAERGITVICNLHSLEIARTYATRVIGLRDGRLVFDGPVTALNDAALAEIYGDAKDTHDEAVRQAA